MFNHAFADDKSIYVVSFDKTTAQETPVKGTVRWYRYANGWDSNSGNEITPPESIDLWAHYAHIFSGGSGIICAVQMNEILDEKGPQLATGNIVWYQDAKQDGTRGWANNGQPQRSPNTIGFEHFLRMSSWGNAQGAVIYGVHENGYLYRYSITLEHGQPLFDAADQVSQANWSHYLHVVYGGNENGVEIVYAIDKEGKVLWAKYDPQTKSVPQPTVVSGTTGWDRHLHVFYGGSGILYAINAEDSKLYRFTDTRRDGSQGSITGPTAESKSGWRFTPAWFKLPDLNTALGYCWPLSTTSGGRSIQFMVSTPANQFTVTYMRLRGDRWIGEVVSTLPAQTGGIQHTPVDSWQRGCGWNTSFELSGSDILNWQSGIYAARCATANDECFIPFVVNPNKPLQPQNQIAVLVNTNTWNAYNDWGGMSVYTLRYARLSLLRPNPAASPITLNPDHMHLLRGELFVPEWRRKNNMNVDVYTDIDFHEMSDDDVNYYKVWILHEHPEYWTVAMYDKLLRYVKAGGNVLYLGGNGLYRMAQYDPNTKTLQYLHQQYSDRKWGWEFRALKFPGDTTRYEYSLLGIGWNGSIAGSAPYKVEHTTFPDFPFFTGTGLSQGDKFGIIGLYLGYAASGGERDMTSSLSPDGVKILAKGANDLGEAQMTGYYHKTSGAPGRKGLVFAVGSLSFGGSLLVDSQLQTIVRNVLAACGIPSS